MSQGVVNPIAGPTGEGVPGVRGWSEPESIAPRGTVLVVPGRGEHAGVYERFGRRIAADGYRVWAVPDPTVDEAGTEALVRGLLGSTPSAADGEVGPTPRVLVGSDAGALFAAALISASSTAGGGVAGLVLAGLPVGPDTQLPPSSWTDELSVRTACPTHQGRLSGDVEVRRGALSDQIPSTWVAGAVPAAISVPVLGLHGADDAVSPLALARRWYAGAPDARLVSVAGGRHDALNDQTHRTAAAHVVLFLERLRLGPDAPAIATVEDLR